MNIEEIEKELEEIPLTEHEWDIVEQLVSEVKRLRKELGSANDAIVLLKTRLKQLQKAVEIEHDQGESFLTQIKELQEENAALRKDKDRLDWMIEDIAWDSRPVVNWKAMPEWVVGVFCNPQCNRWFGYTADNRPVKRDLCWETPNTLYLAEIPPAYYPTDSEGKPWSGN